jgi:hypothetical protein
MFEFPHQYSKEHPFMPHDEHGGYFKIPHPKFKGHSFLCIATTDKEWEHVAVSICLQGCISSRCPTWEEMCFVKDQFWNLEAPVMQLHPAKSEWISNHPYCLHLWRPKIQPIPLPPSEMVGIKQKI